MTADDKVTSTVIVRSAPLGFHFGILTFLGVLVHLNEVGGKSPGAFDTIWQEIGAQIA
jgi:hypothetical protein